MLQKEILQNQKKILELDLIKRNFDIQETQEIFGINKIFALIGSRRAWKTFLTFQIVKEFIEREYLRIEEVCYIDFAWILDKNITLQEIKESYKSLFPQKTPIFIFDEIQELPDFSTQLIGILNQWYKIIITWSNAHLLSKELATILRWKVYTKEVFPLDFKEYLSFKSISISTNDLIANSELYRAYFLDFLQWWWFPEVTLVKESLVKENILKNYFDIMLYKDLQDRYNIKNDFVLKFFIKRVLSTFSKELNINKIYNELKSQNIKISKDSLYNFCEYLDDIYLILQVKNYWAQIKWTKKTYLIDVWFSNLVGNDDFGKRFENVIYLELKKRYKEVFFLNKSYEIDFFLPDEQIYIQVAYELNSENIERETKYLKKQDWKKYLIYFEKNKKLIIPEKIKLISFDEFILGQVL